MGGQTPVACATPEGLAPEPDAGRKGPQTTPVVFSPLTEVPPPPTARVDADLALRDEQNGQAFEIQIGQMVAAVPSSEAVWEVSYDPDMLELVWPLDDPGIPGPAGWQFRTLRPGITVLHMRTKAPLCPTGKQWPVGPVDIFVVKLNVR